MNRLYRRFKNHWSKFEDAIMVIVEAEEINSEVTEAACTFQSIMWSF